MTQIETGLGKVRCMAQERVKAVADNIVESWLCVDCGVNTNPGTPDGPTTRIELGLYGESTMTVTHEAEVYSVRDAIWKQVGMEDWGGCLCIGCLEQRLGRELRPKDFTRHDAKVWARLPCTDRLLDRRGFRKIRVMNKDRERGAIIPKPAADEIAKHIAPGEIPLIGGGGVELPPMKASIHRPGWPALMGKNFRKTCQVSVA
jgi:hypothetical protein